MATKQQLQLEKLNLEYSRFVKDQVLTEVQLNEIIDFFEDQHRITRTCLIGTGIVCGLYLRQNAKSISLSDGVAVTTDGDLLKMSATNYSYFAEYIQADNGKYDPFYYKQGTEEKAVKLFQLLTDDEKTKYTAGEVFNVENVDSKITNWVGVLYLEYYLKNQERCTPTNCDNLGRKQVARPKVLLISKTDLEKVIQKDAGEVIADDIYLKYHEAYQKYFTFPVIRPKRVILNDSNTSKSDTLAGAYFNAAKDGSIALGKAIQDLYNAFKFLIDRDNSFNINRLIERIIQILNSSSNDLYAQYTYDFYKDIVVGYNELRDKLYNVAFECIPNLYAFPKHIMLGAPNIQYGPKPPEYRHQFYPSPAVSSHKHEVNACIGLLDCLNLMVLNFNPREPETIKITPSLDYDKPLEDRSIPFYYQDINSVSEKWNYHKTLKAIDKLNLSYNADHYTPKPVKDETLNPLDYSIDEYNFFRIEGHIGKDYKKALEQLDGIKNEKAVPIDIVAIRLGDAKLSDINLDDFECQFEDLNTLLKAFQAEINCVLSEGSSFFSGFSAKKERPHSSLKRYIADENKQQWMINDETIDSATKEETITIVEEKAGKSASTSNAKETFRINRTVKGKLDEDPASFGKFYKKAMETEGISADEFVEKARSLADDDPDVNSLDENERFVIFEYPTQIVANLNVMQRFVPNSLSDINLEFVIRYRDFSKSFCARIAIMRTRLEKYFNSEKYVSRGFESAYLNMLDRLKNLCCGNEKLEVVMREIDRRKTLILENLSLSKYASRHPGLEHKAGSHRGGTFVIVYASAPKSDKFQAVSEESRRKEQLAKENLANGKNEPDKSQYKDIDSFALYIANNYETVDKEEELDIFFKTNRIEKGSAYSESVLKELNAKIEKIRKVISEETKQPEEDIVIADFCLPYLCCTECPPVAFIIEKEKPVALTLPTNQICDTANPLKFTVSPDDGSIEPKDPAFAATVKPQDDGSVLFDPRAVIWNAGQKSHQIGFNVNGKDTTCSITVFKHPEAVVQHGLEKDDNPLSMNLVVNFTANPANSTEDFTYDWKFGDGQVASGKQVKMTFDKLELVKKGISQISVELTVTNGICVTKSAAYAVLYIPYVHQVLELPKPKACVNEGVIPFTKYLPKGAVVKSAEAPDAVINGDQPAIDTRKVPAESLYKTITFTVGGEPTNCTIVVTKPVTLALSSKVESFGNGKLVIRYTNVTDETSCGKQTYIWNFGAAHEELVIDKTGEFTAEFDTEALKKDKIEIIVATVTLKDDSCNSHGVTKTQVPKDVSNQCQDNVIKLVATKKSQLSLPELAKRVQATRNTELIEIHSSAIGLLTKAADVLNTPDPNQKTAIIEQLGGLLDQIYNFKIPSGSPDIPRILEELLRALLMVMLSLVRCDTAINNRDLKMIMKTLETFHEMATPFRDKYQQLDLQDQLESEVNNFAKNFVSQQADLVKLLEKIIIDLSKFAK
jgi:hypothetical protein